MKKTLIAIASILAIVAGCQKTAIDQKIADGKIYASIEDGTKATLSTDGQDSFMVWSDKDTISLFDGTSNIKCSLTSESGKKFGTFEPATTPEAVATYYAVAPYDTVATLVDGTLTVEYPSTIVYDPAKGPAEGGVNIMVAKASSYNDIKFKNLCGYIKFDITGEAGQKVSKIFIYGEDSQPVNGKATVTFGEGGEPSVAFGTTGTSTVTTVEFAEDVELSATPLSLTLAVAPVYDKGFHVSIYLADGRKFKLASTTSIGRNQIVNMPAVVFSAVDVAEIAGTKYQSLAQAIAAANAATSDVEIKILSNCSSESALKIDNANAKVTIDLNDYYVMSKLEAVNTDFEIKDSGTKGMVMDENSTIRIYDKSNFTLNGGTIIATNGDYALYVESVDSAAVNRPTATIVKGKILATDGTAMRVKNNNGVTFGTEATSADSDILVKGKGSIWSSSKSTVTINKGIFEASEKRLFYIGSSSTDVWNIHGGIFKSDAAFFTYNSKTMNTPVTIDGGKFSWATTFGQAAHTSMAISGGYYTQDVSSFVVNGFECAASTEEAGYNYKVQKSSKPVVSVTIGGTTSDYVLFAGALNAAVEANDAVTIKLLATVNLSGVQDFTNKNGKVVTLDLNGYDLVGSTSKTCFVRTTGELTLTDSSTGTPGTITSNGFRVIEPADEGIINVKKISVTSSRVGVGHTGADSSLIVVMEKATLNVSDNAKIFRDVKSFKLFYAKGTINFGACQIYTGNPTDGSYNIMYTLSGCSVNIGEGACFRGYDKSNGIIRSGGKTSTVNINGGYFYAPVIFQAGTANYAQAFKLNAGYYSSDIMSIDAVKNHAVFGEGLSFQTIDPKATYSWGTETLEFGYAVKAKPTE